MDLSLVYMVRIVEYTFRKDTEKELNKLLSEGYRIIHIGEVYGDWGTIVYTLGRFESDE